MTSEQKLLAALDQLRKSPHRKPGRITIPAVCAQAGVSRATAFRNGAFVRKLESVNAALPTVGAVTQRASRRNRRNDTLRDLRRENDVLAGVIKMLHERNRFLEAEHELLRGSKPARH